MENRARPANEWTEEDGTVLWWKFPLDEPPYVGSPLDMGHTVEVHIHSIGPFDEGEPSSTVLRKQVGGWPGYHTHWTPIQVPEFVDSSLARPTKED